MTGIAGGTIATGTTLTATAPWSGTIISGASTLSGVFVYNSTSIPTTINITDTTTTACTLPTILNTPTSCIINSKTYQIILTSCCGTNRTYTIANTSI